MTVDAPALMQALVDLNRVGNNQNQMTRALNELLLIAREQSSRRLGKSGGGIGGCDPGITRCIRRAGRGDPCRPEP